MADKKIRFRGSKIVEKIKTVSIILLCLCCACLMYVVVNTQGRMEGKRGNFWFGKNTQDVTSAISGETEANMLSAFSALSEPELIMINGTSGRNILYEDDEGYDKAVEAINIIVKDLHTSATEYNKLNDYAEWDNALKVNSVYFRYPCGRQTDFEAKFYGINNSNLAKSVEEYSEILLVVSGAESEVIAMIPNGDGVVKIKTNVSSVALNEIVASQENSAQNVFAFASELNLDKQGEDEAKRILLDREIIVPSASIVTDNILIDVPWIYKNGLSITSSTDFMMKLINIFGYNPNTIRQYSDMSGALVFVADTGTLKAHPDGIIEYKALAKSEGLKLSTASQGKTGDLYSVTSGIIEIARKIYSICDEDSESREHRIRFTSIPQNISETEEMKFEIDYFVDGRRVELAGGHAIEATVVGGVLTEFKMQIKSIKKTAGKSKTEPLFEAIDRFCAENPTSKIIVSSKQIYKFIENGKEIGSEWKIQGAQERK